MLSNDLALRINGTADVLTIQNYFLANQYKIEKVQFDDGTFWTAAQLDAALLRPSGAAAANGTTGSDSFDLRDAANSIVYGFNSSATDSGNDTYVFGAGSGQDTISDYGTAVGNTDTIRILGKSPSQVSLSRRVSGATVTNDLVFLLAGSADKLTVQNYFAADGANKIERVQFDDGTVWTAAQLDALNNTAPVLSNAMPNQSTNEDAVFSFTLPPNTFTDADAGDVLTYVAARADGSALPGWLNFNPATRTFSGTPVNGDVGSVALKVTATDGAGAAVSGNPYGRGGCVPTSVH